MNLPTGEYDQQKDINPGKTLFHLTLIGLQRIGLILNGPLPHVFIIYNFKNNDQAMHLLGK